MRRLAVAAVLSCVVVSTTGASDVRLPARGAFYYPWYPEVWVYGGKHVRFRTTLGYYSSDDPTVVDAHIRALDYGKFDVAIASWWGRGQYHEDTRIPLLMDQTTALGSHLKWALYYEKEGYANPSDAEIRSELDYIKRRYTHRPEYASVGGKPVLFVYNERDTDCSVAEKWTRLAGADFYLDLKAITEFDKCPSQPAAWHQYGDLLYDGRAQLLFFVTLVAAIAGWNAVLLGVLRLTGWRSLAVIAAGFALVCCFTVVGTAIRKSSHTPAGGQSVGDSYVIAPGFWRANEASPRLARDPDRFARNVRDMLKSGKPWQS